MKARSGRHMPESWHVWATLVQQSSNCTNGTAEHASTHTNSTPATATASNCRNGQQLPICSQMMLHGNNSHGQAKQAPLQGCCIVQ
jgi:hypothetical protein